MVFHQKRVRKVQKFTWNGPEKVYFIQGSRRVWCTAISRKNLNWKKKLGKIWKMLTLAISGKNVENEKLDLFLKKSIAPKCKPVGTLLVNYMHHLENVILAKPSESFRLVLIFLRNCIAPPSKHFIMENSCLCRDHLTLFTICLHKLMVWLYDGMVRVVACVTMTVTSICHNLWCGYNLVCDSCTGRERKATLTFFLSLNGRKYHFQTDHCVFFLQNLLLHQYGLSHTQRLVV